MRVESNCVVCSKFFVTYCYNNPNYGKFCSKKCKGKFTTDSSIMSFWTKIDVRDVDSCWLWLKSKTKSNYGRINICGKVYHAHTFAYLLTCQGPVQPNMHICHSCDNPPCCNPYHLFLGTALDNYRDRDMKGRVRHGATHPYAKLDEFDVRQIRMLKNILNINTIAQMYNVSFTTIYDIFMGRTWKRCN